MPKRQVDILTSVKRNRATVESQAIGFTLPHHGAVARFGGRSRRTMKGCAGVLDVHRLEMDITLRSDRHHIFKPPDVIDAQPASIVREQWPRVPTIIATGYDEMSARRPTSSRAKKARQPDLLEIGDECAAIAPFQYLTASPTMALPMDCQRGRREGRL